MESILNSIKKMLGIEDGATYFDDEITTDINTALGILTQLGIGPSGGFSITGPSETWQDFLGDKELEMVKSYIHLKVKTIFDPPTAGTASEAMNKMLSELEWRISVSV